MNLHNNFRFGQPACKLETVSLRGEIRAAGNIASKLNYLTLFRRNVMGKLIILQLHIKRHTRELPKENFYCF